jgi:hypothetical protein
MNNISATELIHIHGLMRSDSYDFSVLKLLICTITQRNMCYFFIILNQQFNVIFHRYALLLTCMLYAHCKRLGQAEQSGQGRELKHYIFFSIYINPPWGILQKPIKQVIFISRIIDQNDTMRRYIWLYSKKFMWGIIIHIKHTWEIWPCQLTVHVQHFLVLEHLMSSEGMWDKPTVLTESINMKQKIESNKKYNFNFR